MISKPRYSRIESLAGKLLASAGVMGPPVPIEEIVKAQGIFIQERDLGDISGILVRNDSSVFIGVNNNESPTRKRFTIAHEFGHVVLHKGDNVYYDSGYKINLRSDLSSTGQNVEEIEANFFAASLLMPRSFLENDPYVMRLDIEDPEAIANLAKRYDVSSQAMSIRLGNLAAMHRR